MRYFPSRTTKIPDNRSTSPTRRATLADARAAPIEDADDRRQDTMPQGRPGIGWDGIRRFQEPPDLVVPEDVRDERGWFLGRQSGLRDVGRTPLPEEEEGQAADQADPCPLGSGTLIRILRHPCSTSALGKAAVSSPCSRRKRSIRRSASPSTAYLYPQACFSAMNFSIHGARALWKVGMGVRYLWSTSGSIAARRKASISTLV